VPSGERELRIELEQRHEHEAPHEDVAVRDRQALAGVREAAEHENVHVDDARAVPDLLEVAAELGFHRLALVEQRLGSEAGLDRERRVEEVRLVEHLALRLGLVERGAETTGMPRRSSPSRAACRLAARSPTFEPRPR